MSFNFTIGFEVTKLENMVFFLRFYLLSFLKIVIGNKTKANMKQSMIRFHKLAIYTAHTLGTFKLINNKIRSVVLNLMKISFLFQGNTV